MVEAVLGGEGLGRVAELASEAAGGPVAIVVPRLGVAVAARGKGAGEALVRACIDRARTAGRRRLLLHTTAWMTTAHRLYERLGFHRDPALDLVFPDVSLIGYALDL